MTVSLYDCVAREECVLVVLSASTVTLETTRGGGVASAAARVTGEVYVERCSHCGARGELVWLEEAGIFLLVGLIG